MTISWPNATDAGAFAVRLGNASVTWEKSGNLNTGIEATLLGNRLGVSIEYYNRTMRDMLLQKPMPLLDRLHGLRHQRRLDAQPGS